MPAVSGHWCEGTGRLHVNVLELVEHFALFIPQEDLSERVVAAQSEVEPVSEGERLEHHGSSRRQSLELSELLIGPFEHLGVTNVARHGQVQILPLLESFDCHHVLNERNFIVENELQGALVPQENDWRLRATGNDKVRLSVHLDKLGICVAEPLVEILVGEETSLVAFRLVRPLVQSGQASLGAVHNHEVPVSVHMEDLNVIWL